MIFQKERRYVIGRLLYGAALVGLPWPRAVHRARAADAEPRQEVVMSLPPARTQGAISVEEAIGQRRTVRSFSSQSLELQQLAQLLWAAQGITGPRGFKRAAPSAGALYPMDVYAVTGDSGVRSVAAGVYHYRPQDHALVLVTAGDRRRELAAAALSQRWMAKAPVSLLVTAEYERVSGKYGRRGERYALMEAGHIGQNIFLQAEALGLKAGIVGAFDDRELIEALQITPAHAPLLAMPVGYGSAR